MTSKEEQNKNIVPKAPRPKITTIPKKISYINLIEVDDDSDSSENEIELGVKKMTIPSIKKEKYKDDGYLSDDRYEDSFDEEFGEGCETNPDSGNAKMMTEE